MAENQSQIQIINDEINRELAGEAVSRALLATTFKGLTVPTMRQAIMDGMIRGFTFKDFREKNVYAVPFGSTYSLVTSIDYSRKLGMRSGIVGKTAPVYHMNEDGTIESCEVTVKRKIGEYVGDYTAKVYFSEYDNGRNLWKSKPRTMIAKVAEMHALRMACPEALSQQYIEEEIELEAGQKRLHEVKAEVDKGDLNMGKFKNENKDQKDTAETTPDASGSDVGKQEQGGLFTT